MVPDMQTRLAAASRAMTEVVIPGIDPGALQALDQAQIVRGTLDMMQDQCRHVFHYLISEIREYRELAESVLALNDSQPEPLSTPVLSLGLRQRADLVVRQTASMAALELPAVASATALLASLKAVVDDMVQAMLDHGSTADGVTGLVMNQSSHQILRERAWNRASGFDADATALPMLDDLLSNR